MVSAAAGLATTGLMPFVATFASFLALLCCEQIRMDVAYSRPAGAPDRPPYRASRSASTAPRIMRPRTSATMRSIADLTVVSPADGPQFAAAIRASATWPQPIYFRIGRGHDPVVYEHGTPFEFGKAIVHRQGDELTIIACGMPCIRHWKRQASSCAQGRIGRRHRHGNGQAARPRGDVRGRAARKILMTVEEHNVLGGLVERSPKCWPTTACGVEACAPRHHDEYSLIAPPTHLYAHYKLDAAGIEEVARKALA